MPRGRRKSIPLKIQDELRIVEARIIEITDELRNLKERRKILEKQYLEQQKSEKLEMIENSGYTVDDLIVMLNEKNKE